MERRESKRGTGEERECGVPVAGVRTAIVIQMFCCRKGI